MTSGGTGAGGLREQAPGRGPVPGPAASADAVPPTRAAESGQAAAAREAAGPVGPVGPVAAVAPVAPVERLGAIARSWRVALVGALGVLFLLGSVVGQDDWWPFGPWRMFSTSTPPTGAVTFMALEVQDGGSPTWRPAGLTPSSVGLNRAEVEGRIPQIEADPALLGTLARSHARLHPAALPWTGVRVVRHDAIIVDRRPTGAERRTVLATWQAAGHGA